MKLQGSLIANKPRPELNDHENRDFSGVCDRRISKVLHGPGHRRKLLLRSAREIRQRVETLPDATRQAKEAYAKFLDLWIAVGAEAPKLRQANAEGAKLHRRGIRREVSVPGGPLTTYFADLALLLPGQLDGDAQQQLAIALFHLPKQAADSIEEATPLARESPLLGR